MRVTSEGLKRVSAGYVLSADVLGADEPELYVEGDRRSYTGTLTELTARADVLQVHSFRIAPASEYSKGVPSPLIVEDFGCMASFLFSGDEFALDGRGEEDDQ